MTKNYESGRSMVEMLGTLAIIGVLSIGGIAGYSYGMDKYRANTTMNDVNLRAVDLIAQVNRGSDLSLSEWPEKSTAGYIITLEKDTDGITGGIKVSNVPQGVCEMLAENLLPQNTTLKINGTDYTSGNCGETNALIFYYDTIMAGVEETCNGPVVDGECQPCEGNLVWNGTICGCASNTEFLENGTCYPCPAGTTTADSGTECNCPAEFSEWLGLVSLEAEGGACAKPSEAWFWGNVLCPDGMMWYRDCVPVLYGCRHIGWCEEEGGTSIEHPSISCNLPNCAHAGGN